MNIAANSLEHHWMPFTANRAFKSDPRLVVKSEGVHLWDHRGGQLLDGSSGLFCVAAGHGRTEIADAVHAQLQTNDYMSPFASGTPGSFELARKLAAILPEGIDHVFFVNSGSEAVDTALKVAMAYNRARGEGQRIRFVSRERAYHGVNIGGVSLSGMVKNRETFPVVMPNVVLMRHTWSPNERFVRGQPEGGAELAEDLQRMIDAYGASTIGACIVEPIAGSTGILVPPKGYLERLREICDTYGILLIFDEVICGFGRTGKAFASQSFGVTPDIMTMAKALTNGAQPMGAVAVSDKVYDTIVDAAPENAIEFFHGYTYSGHPAACAAGIATLDIYENEKLFERAAALSDYFLDKMFELQDIDLITDIRGYGLLAGIDLAPGAAPGLRGSEVQTRLFWNGLHVKFTGDCGIIAPPLVAERSHVDEICSIIRKTLEETGH
ncbi:aspartate aminotransferase family protein [Rhodobium gokarnense]|uniref:Beta-alanine--pyruvate transaminase n=1 Tax=Rhodobium gokarnense TaxID=364296 RepID=A0ABT3HHL9_9HYPH|nr:aspartate aminotransferase family protein [Rhodobium gokarnense]MCW2309912.1 beta-alanine--pyruvate transaminase [Rhodobium gokarnense]